MSLHSGLDTVAIVSTGIFSSTYGLGKEGNIANLFASLGLLEDAPIGHNLYRGLIKIGLSLFLRGALDSVTRIFHSSAFGSEVDRIIVTGAGTGTYWKPIY